ncbi:MAG: sn-glycerol-3-phosphate ABC transporter ATP-binding protein UgpC [Proteobacteria bacterium]|nr:sn-glycerol-3-phosphate ABC transporter ATP-binding protein UgpC [Pseudomonadota bacterium]MDA1357919.1 sn-glycerol-3-phosphate ABC transporter ATP-binding protein UgpC [Pseudomonadota bacterium]
MTSVTIRDVWKYYGKTMAVKDLNIEIKDNEFLCLLGPSGCGKSSTLRMLAGLEFISSGEVFFGDLKVNDIPPRDRDIAMVFENYALYPHKTVFENMANPLKMQKMNKTDIEERVVWAAQMLEIEELLQRKPVELSGGQKQRTAIGRAIVREPKVFLFDEPIAHLDAKLRSHMRGELKHLQRRLETTTVYVTHDQLEGMTMADRIAVMHEGVLQQLGTPSEIYNHPINEFVAGFVGEPPMNFLDCRIERSSDAVALVYENMKVALSNAQSRILEEKGAATEVRLGIRPDDLTIAVGENHGMELSAKIFVTEPLGGDMLIEAKLGRDRITIKRKIAEVGVSGDPCGIALNIEMLHVFNKETGEAFF